MEWHGRGDARCVVTFECAECKTRNTDVLPSRDPECQTCLKARLEFIEALGGAVLHGKKALGSNLGKIA